jgi:putative ABC transport system permease protein
MKAPLFARLLIHLAAPPNRRDDAVGDLEEAHRHRRRHSPAGAWVRSHLDAIAIVVAFLFRRVASSWPVQPGRAAFSSASSSLISTSDLRHAVRLLVHQPLMALTAVVALTVGIGLTTVGFATMEAMLFSTLPFENGERWLQMQPVTTLERRSTTLTPDSYARLAAADGLTHLGAATSNREGVTLSDGRTEELLAAEVTPSSFAHMSAAPLAGRLLLPADAQPGQPKVALLSERYRARIDSAAVAVNSIITIGTTPYTIVGILPESFGFPTSPDVWLPLDEGFLTGTRGLDSDARLFGIRSADVSLPALHTRLAALSTQLQPSRGTDAVTVDVTGFTDMGRMATDLSTVITLVVMAILLVIAANVGNLVLARSFARSREFALRAALGASRSRLVTQVATEVLLLGLVSAALGILVARAALRQFNTMDELPFWVDFTGGPVTAAMVAVATILATLVAGAWPALRATRHDLLSGLQASDGRSSDVRFGRVAGVMVVVQVAVSVMMLHGAFVVAQGFRDFTNVDFDLPANVLTTGMGVNAVRPQPDGTRLAPLTAQDVEDAAAGLPGVIAAGVATALPRHSPPARPIEIEGRSVTTGMQAPSAEVSPSYLAALDTRAVAGRLLTAADGRPGATPVALVNEPFVARYLEGGQAIGRRFRVITDDQPGPWMEVVGVVPDLGLSVADPTRAAGFYTPLRPDTNIVYLALRVNGNPMAYAEPLRRALRERDPEVVPYRAQLLEDVASEDISFFVGFSAALLGLGGVTLVLALVGVYSMMSLIVSRRTQEIGIRMALGASADQIIRTIAGRAALQVLIGGALGAVLAVLSLNARSVLVSRLGDGGSWTLPIVLVLLIAAALVATWVPIRRALRVRPQDSLRAQ